MTDDQLLHTTADGDSLHLCTFQGEPALRVQSQDGDMALVNIPARFVAALRLVADLGPDAVLADIAPLLAQCDREDTSPSDIGGYLYTREIRRLLGRLIPCTMVEPQLAGARCARKDHDSGWHVDPSRRLQWIYSDEGELDVRGWNPQEQPVDGLPPAGTEGAAS